MKKILSAILLLTVVFSMELDFPGVVIPPDAVAQARRAHKYVSHQLILYQNLKTSKYTLFLGCKNYAEILLDIKQFILNGFNNYIAGSNNLVLGSGNVVLGSNNKLAGTDNWVLTEKDVTSTQVQSNVLYIGKWRIKMDKIPQIQYRPERAIDGMTMIDKDIMRNMRNIRDFTQRYYRRY